MMAVFAANLLFPPALDEAVSRRLASCGALRRAATLKPLAVVPSGWHLACRLQLLFTWAERRRVHVYSRRER